MKILVVGNGGREHALAWKLAAETDVSEVVCAPGNAGVSSIARRIPIPAGEVDQLAAFAERERMDLTVIGPELPLDRGIVDRFRARGLRVFGPTRAAAQLECSKVFAKAFMARHGIPTARYRVCESTQQARAVLRSGELGFPIVVKADGLAAGKGVVVASDRDAADAAVRAAMEERQFGEAGLRLVLEECLAGPEVSFFALCDGRRAMPLLSAQDHKRVFDNDEGPNTGGMGAFSPSPLVNPALEDRVMREIVTPVVEGLHADGYDYCGFLYAGLILTGDGPKVIEFNVRFGDPEAQVVIPALAEDLAPRLAAAADGALDSRPIRFRPDRHVGVVLASAGYPAAGPVGLPIAGLEAARQLDDVLVFHAATASSDNRTVTAGGRVLTVVGRGATYEAAIARAYDGVTRIAFEGVQYRRDIGRKALIAAREVT